MARTVKKKSPAAATDDVLNVLNRRFDAECPLSSLREHPDNPNEGDVGNLHVSMDSNGFYGALIAQESTGYIVAGNHRFKTVLQKGAATVPVIWIDCDDSVAKRILVSDNRSRDLASTDNIALAELLESIKIDETGLGFLGTGWDEESYQNLQSDLAGSSLGLESEAEQPEGEGKNTTCPSCGHTF